LKILIVTTRIPRLSGKPDSFTVFKMIEFLSSRHEVALISFFENSKELIELDRLKEICSEVHLLKRSKFVSILSLCLNFLNLKPFQVNYFKSYKFIKVAREVCDNFRPDLGYAHLIRSAQFIQNLKIKKILAYQISHILNYQRLVKNKTFGCKKFFYTLELYFVRKFERKIINFFSKMLFIGYADYETTFPRGENMEKLFISPHGIDLVYFSRKKPLPNNKTIIFPASFSAETNREASEWFCNEIYPLLIAKIPDLQVIFAGRNPSKFLTNFSKNRTNIIVTGYVEDIRVYYEMASVLFNPVRSCAGQQNKILTGMSMKLPVVSTFEANEAINAKDRSQIMLSKSDDPEKFAQNIAELINDKKLRGIISQNGYKFVHENWSWEAHFSDLEENLISRM